MAIFKAYVNIPLAKPGETLLEYKQRTVQYLQKLLFDVYDGEAYELNYGAAKPHYVRDPEMFQKHHNRYGWNERLEILEADAEGELISHPQLLQDSGIFQVPTFEYTSFVPDEDQDGLTNDTMGLWEHPNFIHWGIPALDSGHLDVYLHKYFNHADHSLATQTLYGLLFATPCKKTEMRDPTQLFSHKIVKAVCALDELLSQQRVKHTVEYKLDDLVLTSPFNTQRSLPPIQEQLPPEDTGPSADDLWNMFRL